MNTAIFLAGFWAVLGGVAALITAFGLFIIFNLILAVIGAAARKGSK